MVEKVVWGDKSNKQQATRDRLRGGLTLGWDMRAGVGEGQ